MMLAVQDISKSFRGLKAVSGASFDVAQGSGLAIEPLGVGVSHAEFGLAQAGGNVRVCASVDIGIHA